MLVRVRACGICGTDAAFLHMGGMPTHAHMGGDMMSVALGHEPATLNRERGARSSPTMCPSTWPPSTNPSLWLATASTVPQPGPATRSSSSAPGPSAWAPRSG
ncbi:alcohol dehydrogenase catalytic domain-containing protein [Streptomyces sp. CG4]|uniref:alcohol dehydrogenase catalytic domain-containing protein n=1 Tax=Streptomyces sp. CG4 TaxID=408783 RepID=UPI0034E29D57